MPAEKFDFHSAQGHSSPRCSTGRTAGAHGRAVCALLHLWQGQQGGAAHCRRSEAARHRGAALRFHRARRQRGRVRQHDVLLERRRPGRRGRSLAAKLAAPAILIGHSLGGAAVLAAAHRIAEARAVVTINAPSDPGTSPACSAGKLARSAPRARSRSRSAAGSSVSAARCSTTSPARTSKRASPACARRCSSSMRRLTIRSGSRTPVISSWRRSIRRASFRSPAPITSSTGTATPPTSASVIAAWAERYLDIAADAQPVGDGESGEVVVRETRRGQLQQEVIAGRHRLLADHPEAAGGLDSGPGPYDLLLAALGACTSMTVRLYADRKSLPLKRTSVRLRHGEFMPPIVPNARQRKG